MLDWDVSETETGNHVPELLMDSSPRDLLASAILLRKVGDPLGIPRATATQATKTLPEEPAPLVTGGRVLVTPVAQMEQSQVSVGINRYRVAMNVDADSRHAIL